MAPRSARKAYAPHAASARPAAAVSAVHSMASRKIACNAPAVASSAIPARRISPDRNRWSISAAPLQIAGVQSQRDGADDQEEDHRLAADQALHEIGEMQGERQIPEQAAQGIGGLE